MPICSCAFSMSSKQSKSRDRIDPSDANVTTRIILSAMMSSELRKLQTQRPYNPFGEFDSIRITVFLTSSVAHDAKLLSFACHHYHGHYSHNPKSGSEALHGKRNKCHSNWTECAGRRMELKRPRSRITLQRSVSIRNFDFDFRHIDFDFRHKDGVRIASSLQCF